MRLLPPALLLALIPCAAVAWSAYPPTATFRTDAQNFKDMALMRCLATAFPSVAEDAERSMNILDGLGGHVSRTPPEMIEGVEEPVPHTASELLDQFIEQFLGLNDGHPSNIRSSGQVDMLNCFDFYHSPELGLATSIFVPNFDGRAVDRDKR